MIPLERDVLAARTSEEDSAPYAESLAAVGIPAERLRFVTPAKITPEEARRLAAEAAGVVLCGGVDVAPQRFGEEVLNSTVEVIPERDDMEWALIEGARRARVPVWGICRGIQVLNVFFGGTLWQDLPAQLPTPVPHNLPRPRDLLAHPLHVLEPGHPLGEVLAREPALVNSRHHQAIRRLAPGFIPVAETLDGLVEAAVLDDPKWWVRAVQWHPENLIHLAQQRALFEDFARALQGKR